MRSYSTARALFSFIEFVAWTVVVAGVILAIVGFGAGNVGGASFGRGGGGALGAIIGALPGVFLTLFGLIGAAIVQNSRANVDSAEMAGKMLKIAEEQLQLAKAAGKAGFAAAAPSPAPHPTFAPPARPKPGHIEVEPACPNGAANAIDGAAAAHGASAALPAASVASSSKGPRYIETIEHAGWVIRKADDGKFYVGAQAFEGLSPAKAFAESKRGGGQ